MNPLSSRTDARISLVMPPVEFGTGAVSAVAAFMAGRGLHRAFVVADGFNGRRAGVLGLPAGSVVSGPVRPEPQIADLDAALAQARDVQPDIIVGFGGGSAMDVAKLVAVLARSPQTLRDIVGPERAHGPRLPLVQVPTTAGTGSEMGTRALVTDPDAHSKLAVQSWVMLADLAVVDPALTMTVPRAATAAAGIDAMTHCVEAFTNRRAHPAIDLYALEGIRLVGEHLPRAVRDGSDAEARAGLALASLYGGICLGPVNTTAGHAVAYPLGVRHHVPHGLSCAVIFPHTLAFNARSVPERTAQVLRAMGLPDRLDEASIVAHATQWCAERGATMRLSQLDIPEADLDAMADEASGIRRLLDNNPRDIARDDIRRIYAAAW